MTYTKLKKKNDIIFKKVKKGIIKDIPKHINKILIIITKHI